MKCATTFKLVSATVGVIVLHLASQTRASTADLQPPPANRLTNDWAKIESSESIDWRMVETFNGGSEYLRQRAAGSENAVQNGVHRREIGSVTRIAPPETVLAIIIGGGPPSGPPKV